MCKIRFQYRVQFVLILFIQGVTKVQSNAYFTPDTVIHLAEPLSKHMTHEDMGTLTVESIVLTRRQTTMNGLGDGDVAHSTPFDDNGRYVGTYSPRCHETFIMASMQMPKILELDPDILEEGGHLCHWAIIGTGLCVPQISCSNFSLMEPTNGSSINSTACEDDYLEVFDGSIGKSTYCGSEGPQNVMSGRYLRDLYITLKLAPVNGSERMFKCSVSCHHSVDDMVGDDDPGNELPDLDEEPKVSTSCWCGRADIHDEDGEARKLEFPWNAALVTAQTRKPFCAGTLINSIFLLTAAHCFRGRHKNISNFDVLINANRVNITKIPRVKKGANLTKYLMNNAKLNARDKEDNSYRYKVQKYYIHPLFTRQNRDFDVALVRLEESIDFKTMKDIVPICLPDPGQYEHNKEGTHAVVTGWGLTSFVNRTLTSRYYDRSNKFRILEKQWLEVFSHDQCRQFFKWKYTHRMMCAGHKLNEYKHESQVEAKKKDRNKDKDKIVRMCSADPGSALISFRSKTIYEQIGIMAYPNMEGCEFNKTGPAIFTDTRQISNWINYVCTIEGAVWCSA